MVDGRIILYSIETNAAGLWVCGLGFFGERGGRSLAGRCAYVFALVVTRVLESGRRTTLKVVGEDQLLHVSTLYAHSLSIPPKLAQRSVAKEHAARALFTSLTFYDSGRGQGRPKTYPKACLGRRGGLSVADARQDGSGKKKRAAEAAAARARLQASLLGGSSQRASGAGSSSQDICGVAVASESTETAAAGDRAAGSAEPPAAAADDVLEQGEGAAGSSGQQARAVA